MKKINIYTYVTIKGPGKRSGSFTYLLEFVTGKGNATLTKQGAIEEQSETGAQLQVLTEALERVKEPCEVTIYTEFRGLKTGLEEWIPSWEQNGWKNAKGKDVANKEEWQKVAYLLREHVFSVKAAEPHTYREWIKTETEKIEQKRKVSTLSTGKSG